MELRAGYKQTDVGVIPEDWDVIPLRNDISALNAGVSVNSVDENITILGHSESVLKTSCVSNGYFHAEECKKILPKDISRAKLNPKKDSIIFSRMNTPALVGECGYINTDYPNLFLPDRLWQTSFKQGAGVNVRWLAYILSFGQFSKAIKDTATGTSGSMKNIAKDALLNIQIPHPTKTEQTAIANALSDADALIQSLTHLIAKKRQIKQGAMQTLLNPYENGRLKAGWVVKKLGEIGSTYGGLSGKTKADFGAGSSYYIPFLNVMNNIIIDIGYIERVQIAKNENQNRARKGDLFFNGSSETPDELGLCAVLKSNIKNLYLNSFCFGFRLHNDTDVNATYLAYFFRSNYGRELLYSLAQGSTRYNLSKANFLKLEIPAPNFTGQSEISAAISDMDTDIAALETKLTKTQQIKQGMMQNLLTGRIRLL